MQNFACDYIAMLHSTQAKRNSRKALHFMVSS